MQNFANKISINRGPNYDMVMVFITLLMDIMFVMYCTYLEYLLQRIKENKYLYYLSSFFLQ